MTPDDEDRPGDADGAAEPTAPRTDPSGAEPVAADTGPATPASSPAKQPWDNAGYDAAFADIVARLQSDGVDSGPSTSEALPDRSAGPRPDPPAEDTSPDSTLDAAAIARQRRLEREIDAAVDGPDGGHYIPPDPAPLPRPDAITLFAWLAVIGGPLILVAGTIVNGLPTWLAGGVVAAVVVGFVLLVSRLPRRGDVDPGDDGAVV